MGGKEEYMGVQINHFINGGGAIHKITGDHNGNISAWFSKNGVLLDAEQIRTNNKVYSIKKNGPLWIKIEVKYGYHFIKEENK